MMTSNTLHCLKISEDILSGIHPHNNPESEDIKDAKKVHLQEINQANSVIKTLEKGGKGLENDTHNLKQNLKEPSYHLS